MKYILSGLAVLTLVLVVVLGVPVKRRKSSEGNSSEPVNPNNESPTPSYNSGGSSTSIDVDKLLLLGSRGGEVELLQKGMNEEVVRLRGLNVQLQQLTVDGNFGAKTEALLFRLTNKKAITLRQALQLLEEAYN